MVSMGGSGQLTHMVWLVMVRGAEETSDKTERGVRRYPGSSLLVSSSVPSRDQWRLEEPLYCGTE